MCTAVTLKTKCNYFGRNLDLEYSYNETVTITPREYEFVFSNNKRIEKHYSMIGMAYVVDNYPLYYDATNEKGLSMAGLSFHGNAFYGECIEGRDNISPYELIPWILCQCSDVDEARLLLGNINLINKHFSMELPLTDLHWIIADKRKSIVLEPLRNGLKIYENPVGILTNNPTFEYHLQNLNNYMSLSKESPTNSFSDKLNLKSYSRGMGALGLPGDLSSASRFIKASFTKYNSVCNNDEEESVSQFFHILSSVEQQRGCVEVDDKYEITVYSSCCNVDEGIYYYRTYDNNQISSIKMNNENLASKNLIVYKLIKRQQILPIN